jgi:uncharacterized protein (DUF433 family)
MIDWSQCPAVEQISGKVGGACRNTRVPVTALFENLEGGETISEFLEWFDGASGHQVEALLDHALKSGSR